MNSKTYELNDTDLNEVSGGMTCAQAAGTARILAGMANVLAILGNNADSNYLSGLADGFVAGGCPGK
jgi:hypothetical protein